MALVLLDSNLLIYAHDQNDASRQARALEILREVELAGAGRLSVQNLAEFFNVVTRRLKPPLTPSDAAAQVELLTRAFPVFDLTVAIVREAARGARTHQLAYYDAQLWATARLNQIPVVFSEDFNVGAMLEGVRFVNPFARGFVLEDWV